MMKLVVLAAAAAIVGAARDYNTDSDQEEVRKIYGNSTSKHAKSLLKAWRTEFPEGCTTRVKPWVFDKSMYAGHYAELRGQNLTVVRDLGREVEVDYHGRVRKFLVEQRYGTRREAGLPRVWKRFLELPNPELDLTKKIGEDDTYPELPPPIPAPTKRRRSFHRLSQDHDGLHLSPSRRTVRFMPPGPSLSRAYRDLERRPRMHVRASSARGHVGRSPPTNRESGKHRVRALKRESKHKRESGKPPSGKLLKKKNERVRPLPRARAGKQPQIRFRGGAGIVDRRRAALTGVNARVRVPRRKKGGRVILPAHARKRGSVWSIIPLDPKQRGGDMNIITPLGPALRTQPVGHQTNTINRRITERRRLVERDVPRAAREASARNAVRRFLRENDLLRKRNEEFPHDVYH